VVVKIGVGMSRVVGVLKFVAAEFGPLLVFWLLALTVGLKTAIVGSLAVMIGDGLWRWRRGVAFTRLYKLTSGLTLIFGAIDLFSAQPFMLKYESVISNLAISGMFVVGAFGAKPMLQEFAEKRQGEAFPDSASVRRFFQIFTLFWGGYFFCRAALYFWLAWTLPMTLAMAWRTGLGGASLGVMIVVSVTQGRRMFFLLRRLGWLPAEEVSGVAEPTHRDNLSS
jgi:intracellular septation protein A